jgi:hypothetical protein
MVGWQPKHVVPAPHDMATVSMHCAPESMARLTRRSLTRLQRHTYATTHKVRLTEVVLQAKRTFCQLRCLR